MDAETTRYVICYDIPDDKRRTKVAKCLDGFGDRIQWSVFEAVMDHALIDKLIAKVQDLIDPDEDQVRIYALCAACAKRVRTLGAVAPGPEVGEETVFIV